MTTAKYINEWTVEAFTEYLRNSNTIEASEKVIALTVAGEGNMNLTLRVQTAARSLIVKQSLPYVAKYPSIPAPVNRIAKEIQFYQTIQSYPELAQKVPAVLHFDPSARIAVIEDLGKLPDYTSLYDATEAIDESTLSQLAEWLAALHQVDTDALRHNGFDNTDMLRLNHAHIFDLPFRADNGFDLEAICTGLTPLAREIQKNPDLVNTAKNIGDTYYLAAGHVLTHGDFYPGSILQTEKGPAVIDPEFCALGRREFDLGVFHAHLLLSQQAPARIDHFLQLSQSALSYDAPLAQQFAGIEMIRRIIGIAQLPAQFDLESRRKLLQTGSRLMSSQ